MRYAGKRVVITGGTSGIGLATAKLLIAEGARVLVTSRKPAKVEGAIAVQSDASSLAEIAALATRIEAELGTIDMLFVNAGTPHFAPFEAQTEEAYDHVFAVNTKGPYFTVQKLAPLINRGGSIIFTTSVVNEMGFPMTSVYSASKAALRSMVRTFGVELVARGIRVNAVSPGPTETPILDDVMPAEALAATKRSMTDANPMKRFAHPDEIARAVIFLAFDATYMTGSELAVDGGGSQF